MIKCPGCGFSNDDNCTFCAICGSSVTQDNFYVHNTTNAGFSVEELTERLISKDKQENAKTKSFKKLDKATIAKEAARIESENEKVKEYKGSSKSKTSNITTTTPKTDDDVKIRTKNNTTIKPTEVVNKIEDTKPVNVGETKTTKTESKPKETTTDKAIPKTESNANENTANKAIAKADSKPKENPTDKTATANSNADESTADKTIKDESSSAENKANDKSNNPVQAENNSKDSAEKEESQSATAEENQATSQTSTDSKLYNMLSKFFFDTKDETARFKQKDIDENCSLAMISYIPFLFFVPMIINPCSGYLRYHGIQGLTMFLSFIALEFFDIMLSAICNSIFNDMVGMLLTIIITVAINMAVLLLISIGIANAVKGTARELPIIGKYKFLKPYIY